jgi:hypothetical protein
MTGSAEILSLVSITQVWSLLGGGELRRKRGRAWWRNGDGWSVSVDDRRGCWYDHRDGIGGGVLDLIVKVRGGSHADALRWLAAVVGVPVDDRPLSYKDRQRWALEREQTQRIRSEATYFADAATELAELELEELSQSDPARFGPTAFLSRLRLCPEAEYCAWLESHPQLAAGLVHAGQERERRIVRMLWSYMTEEA